MVNISAATPNLGDAVDRVDIGDEQPAQPFGRAGEAAEPKGPERDAREQVAEHRAYPDVEEQRRHDAGRHQEQQRLAVDSKVDGRIHSSLTGGAKACSSGRGRWPRLLRSTTASTEPRQSEPVQREACSRRESQEFYSDCILAEHLAPPSPVKGPNG